MQQCESVLDTTCGPGIWYEKETSMQVVTALGGCMHECVSV